MAISFVAAGAVATGANPTVAVPSGVAAGDLLLLVNTGSGTPTNPAGWTRLSAQGAGQFITIAYKYASNSETSVAVTQAGTTTKAVMLAYRGGGAFQVLPAYTTGTGTTATPNTLTTTYANDYVISIYADANTAANWTANGSTTSRVNSSSTSTLRGLLIADELQVAAGTSTARAATLSASVAWSSVAIALIESRTVYWVGGPGTWNASATTNWADSSGGTGGVVAPSPWDNVVIDGSSGTGTGINCSSATCQNCTATASQALQISGNLSVYGSLSFPTGGNFATSLFTLTFAATTTGNTLNSGSKNVGAVNFNGIGGEWSLSAPFNSQDITLTTGSLDTNNQAVDCQGFISAGSGTKVLTLGTSTITSSIGANAWQFATTTGLTFSGASSTINLSNASPTFAGGGLTYGTVNFTSTALSTVTITGANSYGTLSFTARAASGIGGVLIGANQTITSSFSVQSGATDPTRRLVIRSDTPGTQRTITSASNTIFGADFLDINATGAASWNDSSRTDYWGDCKGNTGITFATGRNTYWNLAAVNATKSIGVDNGFTTISGGTPSTTAFPLAQDTMVFNDANAMPSGTGQLFSGATWNFGTVDFSGRTIASTFNVNTNISVFGNWTNGSGLTLAGTASITFAGRTTQTITSASKSFTQPIIINSIGGTVQQADALTTSNTFTLTNGTYLTQNNNLTCTTFTYSATGTASLTLGTSTVTLSGTGTVWSFGTITGLTFSGASSTIVLSNTSTTARTFAAGGSLTYGTVTIGGTTGTSTTTISGAGSGGIETLNSTKTVAHTIQFASSPIITNWAVTGTSGNVVTVNSSTAGTARTLTITNRTSGIDYLDVRDITANLAPVTFYAGANTILRSNVQGVAAIAPTANEYIYVLNTGTSWTVPANWNSSNNEIHLFAGGGGGAGARFSTPNGAGGGGGGGAGYTKATNISLTPSSSVSYAIGAAGAAGAANANGTAGGATTFNAGAYTTIGGGGGSATTTSSTGGTAGTGSTNNGGVGGQGGLSTTAGTSTGGGGGGGAGGELGVGGNGGNGINGATTTGAAGGGGGNGGGTNGGNAVVGAGGTGGNNANGVGGGAARGDGFSGGGAGGADNNTTNRAGGTGIDIAKAGMGGGGGIGGSTASTTTYNSFFGAGGGGGGVQATNTANAGIRGTQGGIVIVYTFGGTTFTGTVTEDSSLADVLSALGIFAGAAVENSNLADVVDTSANTFNSSRTENSAIADSESASWVTSSDTTENSTLADSASAEFVFSATITEPLNSADSTNFINVLTAALVENAGLASIQSAYVAFAVTRTENSGLASVQSVTAVFAGSVSENSTLVDIESIQTNFQAAVTEALDTTDIESAQVEFNSSVTEPSTVEDQESALKALAAAITENADLADEQNRTAIFFSSLEEVSALADLVAAQANFNSQIAENLVSLDQVIGRGWFRVVDSQTVVWTSVDNGQTTTWSNIGNTQNPNWVVIDNSQE